MRLLSLTIVRHGETPWTITGQHTGSTDLELTAHGKEQALLLKKQLEGSFFDQIWTSPSKRARETCSLAGFSAQANILGDLAEWNYGDYEGKTSDEIRKIDPDWTIFSKNPPNGETRVEIGQRADRALSKFSGHTLIFSSGHISRVIAARFLGFEAAEGKHLSLFPASISVLGFEHGEGVIKLWNYVANYTEKSSKFG